MDPLTLGIGAIGLGMQLYGKFAGSDSAEEYAQLEKKQAGLEMGINQQKKQQMELSGRRQLLENFRNAQRLRAQGVNSAVNQGAQFGTGMQGGLYQNTSQGHYNALGIDQNLEIGRSIFGLNDQISGVKMQMADVKTDMNNAQGWSSLGGSILQSSSTIAALGKSGFGAGSNFVNGSTGGPGYSPSPMMRMFS